MTKTKFYTFNQNNSGGSFTGPAPVVVVEAVDYRHANGRAEDLGLYFDGCERELDCPCCGDRWSRQYSESDADEVPSNYGKPLSDPDALVFTSSKPEYPKAVVYYLDGREEKY